MDISCFFTKKGALFFKTYHLTLCILMARTAQNWQLELGPLEVLLRLHDEK